MATFYFIDSNIIMGYCNPEDTFHEVGKGFFKEKPSREMLLLFSIQEEYLRKIEDERAFFYNEIIRKIRIDFPSLQRIIRIVQSKSKYKNNNFIKYILSILKQKGITHVSFTILQEVFSEYTKNLRDQFKNLTQNWIKRPYMKNHTMIFKDQIYLYYFNKLNATGIHPLDSKHLALASYEVRSRNRRNRNHQFYFYTNDKDWFQLRLDSHINIKNFKIIRIQYKKSNKRRYNQFTRSYNKINYEYIPDNL